ncbi:3-dehydroquinate synthase [Staphylococcus pasteuri]|uniref:3-dehydroquinate synthase n=1 Tax=Staphylococcus pasteuri TaxID=45972 RepID=UPI003261BDCD
MKLNTTYQDNNYPIIVEHGAINQLQDFTQSYDQSFFIIDETVYQHFKDKIDHFISVNHAHKIIIPSGEQTKSFNYFHEIVEHILSFQITRNTAIIAIGGGATGDFAGFIAASVLRGVSFIQVPTTILAHDSSIGGKVGINSQHGKNLIGAFYRPKAVIYDLDFLTTLPYSEVLSGYAEVYKHALLNGQEDTSNIEQHFPNKEALASLDDIETYIYKGIETKLNIVVNDEKEQGIRKFLNLGHTFGHAIEYKYKIPHGHAVMIGIVYQFIVSNQILKTTYDIDHYLNYLDSLGYPINIIKELEFDDIYQYMLLDKKNNQDGIQMVLMKSLGHAVVEHVNKSTHLAAFNELQSKIK